MDSIANQGYAVIMRGYQYGSWTWGAREHNAMTSLINRGIIRIIGCGTWGDSRKAQARMTAWAKVEAITKVM